MTIKLTASASLITPAWDKKGKDLIARKSGFKHVAGDVYKQRTSWKLFIDFICGSRAVSVVGKAHFESKQYVQAALLRKSFAAEGDTNNPETKLSDADYDKKVWNSKGVQNRITRQDFVRYNPNYYSKEKGATKNNLMAHKLANVAHAIHGITEMCAAPTGLTYNAIRNVMTPGTDEKSTKNKILMFGMLGFIGVGTTELLLKIKGATDTTTTFLTQSLTGMLVSFPIASSMMGLLGTFVGLASQAKVERQTVSDLQKEDLNADLSMNLQKILFRVKAAKADTNTDSDTNLVQIMAKAMQGKNHLVKKIKADSLDENNVPVILKDVIDAIDVNKTDIDNMNAMKIAIGRYLQVDKPTGDSDTPWARFRYAKAVTTKESHYVALAGLVEHMEIEYKNEKELKDLRRNIEEVQAPKLHDWLFNQLAKPAGVFDKLAKTQIAPKLEKWGSEAQRKKKAEKLNNPALAAKYCFKGEYMAKNTDQYGKITRSLIVAAESMRMLNMNIVLASNANLSRVFNNIALQIQGMVTTGPASRTMCNSVGRFFGGAALALIFGTVVPIAADATGRAYNYNLNTVGEESAQLSATNIGILMFILSVPTLMVQGLAQLSARLEGWKGNIARTVPSNTKSFRF